LGDAVNWVEDQASSLVDDVGKAWKVVSDGVQHLASDFGDAITGPLQGAGYEFERRSSPAGHRPAGLSGQRVETAYEFERRSLVTAGATWLPTLSACEARDLIIPITVDDVARLLNWNSSDQRSALKVLQGT
jgi:hypothetical protein